MDSNARSMADAIGEDDIMLFCDQSIQQPVPFDPAQLLENSSAL